MKNTKLRKVVATAAAIVSLTVISPAVVYADGNTGGGTGGGSSDGSQHGVHWASLAYKTPGKAYDKFIDKAGYRKSHTDTQIKKRVGNLKLCQRSNVIWYIKSGSNWTFNYDGATHGSRWHGSGTIENPKTEYGRGPTDAEIRTFKIWDKEKNSTKINKKPGYTIICSGAFDMPDKTRKTVTDNRKDPDIKKNTYNVTKPYSWTTEIKPQHIKVVNSDGSPKNNKIDPIGNDNLESQGSKAVKSNYGKLWDNLNKKNSKLKPSEIKKKVNTALKKDKKLKHSTLNLSKKNKEGMAEGGVLNVYDRSLDSTISATETIKTITTTTCIYTQKWNMKKGKYDKETKKCTTKKDKSSKTNVVTKNPTQSGEKFWQMLAVHCNRTELDALLKADKSIKLVDTGDSSKGIAAVVYSKKYDKQPANLDFGDSKNSNKAKAATGLLSFYDKECPFDCTPSSDSKNGASAKNGANKNVESTGKIAKGGKYGATSEGHTNNFFEFFRDNEEKSVSVDVWYPKSEGNVDYDGSAPLTTTIIRDKEGTPGVSGKDGGKFTMKTKKSDKELFTGKKDPLEQKNWDSGTEFSNSNSELLKGLHREFLVKATWASDTGKPQVINSKWEYKANVSTKFFAKNVGFGVNGAQQTGETVKVSTPIEGKCYSNFGTKDQFDTTKLFNENTGTGTTNNLDKKVIENSEKPSDKKTNLVFNFVRSTTE